MTAHGILPLLFRYALDLGLDARLYMISIAAGATNITEYCSQTNPAFVYEQMMNVDVYDSFQDLFLFTIIAPFFRFFTLVCIKKMIITKIFMLELKI